MKSPDHQSDLPESVRGKLRAIRRRAFVITLFQGAVLAVAALLGVLMASMLLDLAVGWFSTTARYAVTLIALATATAALIVWCVQPLLRRRTIVSTARDVDRLLPALEERWSTVTELAQSQDAPEIRGSEAMIHRVGVEAESANAGVNPDSLVSGAPVLRALRWLALPAAAFALFFAFNAPQATLLFERFCMPGRSLSLTQVTANPADVWVPKGESLTLDATLQGRVPAGLPSLLIRRADGAAHTVAMTRKTGTRDAFQYAVDQVTDSFEYRVRAGDGQTPWHRITAVERPKISAVRLKVTPPSYSHLAVEEKDALPQAIRILEGSTMEAGFRSDQPLDRLYLSFGNGVSTTLTADKDHWYQYRIQPTNNFAFTAVALNQFQLENKTQPSCRVTVFEDLPPTVKLLEPSDDLAVAPDDKVDVAFEASDDFGLAKAELIVATTKASGETNGVIIPIPLDAQEGRKQVRQTVQLDPKALGLQHGDQLTYVVQVTDTKQTPAQVGGDQSPSSRSAQASNHAQGSPNHRDSQADARQMAENAGDQRPQEPQEPKDPTEAGEARNDATASPKSSSLASNAKPKPPAGDTKTGSQPPPNDMAMRALDVGQSAACKPRNITVDQWAGTFDAEKRQKIEMAIEPVLKRLDELLAQAQEPTDLLKRSAAAPEGLVARHVEPLRNAREKVREAEEAVADLKSRSAGTPYAFIGLQVDNIKSAHVSPAGKNLERVNIGNAAVADNVPQLDQAVFHLARAREMLADLTRTYETVKRDQHIADAMQKLNKMYQIFLEDTQALLGGGQGPINSYNRKIAEVDDAYVEKLKALLEEKKKIMAELAKVLADDPRLLRRYLAMLQLQSTSYRDQLTLLAERQKQISQQLAAWNAAPESDRPALLTDIRQAYAPLQGEVMKDAAKLRENLETWLPLDISPDLDQVQSALRRAEKITQLAGETARPGAPDPGLQALTELHALRESLPGFSAIASTNQARLAAYIANRLPEIDALITAQSGRLKISEALGRGDFAQAAEVIEHRLAVETATLGEKLDATEQQVSEMSDAIAEKAALLTKTVQTDIVPPQTSTVEHLSSGKTKAAEDVIGPVVPAFALAEQTFDELMGLILAKLDEAPPPSDPGQAQDLQSLLAMLDDERKAAEGLGIPCRPLNVSIMRDWMRPASNPGQGMGQARAQAQAARAQAQKGQMESERLERQARASARKALASARQQQPSDDANASEIAPRGESWNKLASRLQKDLLQGRDNTPPEQYRAAIEHYFRTLPEATGAAAR